MKRIQVAVLAMAMSCCICAIAMAQTNDQAVIEKKVAKKVKSTAGKETMMPAPEVQLKRMTKGLQLTDEQQQQIRPLLEDESAKLKAIRNNENLSPKQIRKQVEEMRSDTNAKIQTYLTPEQKEKHDMVRKEIKAARQKRIKENRKARLGSKADPPQQSKQ
jgi:periplasmic protein CpxP/Spy